MLAFLSLRFFHPPSLAVREIDIALVEFYDEEELSAIAPGTGTDDVRSCNIHRCCSSSDGENFRLAVGNENGVFIVGRELAVGCHGRPFVAQHTYIIRALRDHGFDRKRHAFDHARASSGGAIIRDGRLFVQYLTDAMPDERANHAKSVALDIGDYLLGKDKYKKAEQYFRKVGNMRSAAFALRDVGRMYVFADSSEVGLRYLLEADTIIAELGDSSDIGYISNGIGNVYSVLGNIELAKQYLWKSINVSELDNAPDYSALAGVYIEEGDFKNARLCLEQANIIPTLNENTHISIIYNYYELEKAEGNIENALTYLEQYNEAADSILALQNKANIVKTEKAYNHLKISLENTQLKMDKQWTFILLVTSITVCLLLLFVYQLQMNKKNKRIYVQQIDIEQKNIELLKLQNSLNIKQRELQDLFDKLSKEDELLNISYSRAKLEERYERTKQEEKSIIQRIAEQRNNLFLSSMIARKVIKLSQKVIPGTTKSPLSEKYWRNIITQANEVYPSLEKKFSEFNMTLADLRYLVLFHLDTISEAILLNIQPDSVNKRRQRVRQKLGIIGEELDLYTYIINMM